MGLDPSLRGNIVLKHYECGHMVYVCKSSLDRFAADAAAFVTAALPAP